MNAIERQYEELGKNFRAVWDFYMKYHIAFLILNLGALLFTSIHAPFEHRKPVALAFIFQNAISGITALGIAAYSQQSARQQESLLQLLLSPSSSPHGNAGVATGSVIPAKLAIWAGAANAVAHIVFSVCWYALL